MAAISTVSNFILVSKHYPPLKMIRAVIVNVESQIKWGNTK